MASSLGSGAVEYTPQRLLIHFGTPPAQAEAQMRLERIRKSGGLLDSNPEGRDE